MAGMFGSQYNDTKVMIDDLSNLSQMNTAAKASSEGVMKPPKGEDMDAGSWWAWLSGYTRQKTQENVARVQEELASMGVDTTGLSPEYQQSMLEGIQQAQAYRDKWNITTALGDAPTMLEEQGVFPQTSVEQPVGVAAEDLDANEMPEKPSLMDRAIDMFRPSEPEPNSVDTSKPEAGGGLMEKPLPPSESRGGVFKAAEQDAMNIAIDNIGIDEDMWAAYKKEVAKIESGGKKNPYQVAGGANKHYDGKYQLGKMAKADAGQLLGIELGHGKKDRDLFRKNPALQEKAFAAYTAKNHSYLMNKSAKYRELDKQQQIAVLGYAHNQGWSEAKKWLDGGAEGQDAFGTKGSKYYKAIAKNLGITPTLAFTEGRETSPRPRLRDDK